VHIRSAHQALKQFVCHFPDCATSYNYKHLLQRHIRAKHRVPVQLPPAAESSSKTDFLQELLGRLPEVPEDAPEGWLIVLTPRSMEKGSMKEAPVKKAALTTEDEPTKQVATGSALTEDLAQPTSPSGSQSPIGSIPQDGKSSVGHLECVPQKNEGQSKEEQSSDSDSSSSSDGEEEEPHKTKVANEESSDDNTSDSGDEEEEAAKKKRAAKEESSVNDDSEEDDEDQEPGPSPKKSRVS